MKRLSAVAHDPPKQKSFPTTCVHLFAVQFYQKHRDIVRLADMLGHSSVETTRIYLAASTDECARALDQLGLSLNGINIPLRFLKTHALIFGRNYWLEQNFSPEIVHALTTT